MHNRLSIITAIGVNYCITIGLFFFGIYLNSANSAEYDSILRSALGLYCMLFLGAVIWLIIRFKNLGRKVPLFQAVMYIDTGTMPSLSVANNYFKNMLHTHKLDESNTLMILDEETPEMRSFQTSISRLMDGYNEILGCMVMKNGDIAPEAPIPSGLYSQYTVNITNKNGIVFIDNENSDDFHLFHFVNIDKSTLGSLRSFNLKKQMHSIQKGPLDGQAQKTE